MKKNCPSCNASPSFYKDGGSVKYNHINNCEVGKVMHSTGTIAETAKSRYGCTRCFATFTIKACTYPGDNSGIDCPFCWARAEANNKING